jgi:hypothetical protein
MVCHNLNDGFTWSDIGREQRSVHTDNCVCQYSRADSAKENRPNIVGDHTKAYCRKKRGIRVCPINIKKYYSDAQPY